METWAQESAFISAGSSVRVGGQCRGCGESKRGRSEPRWASSQGSGQRAGPTIREPRDMMRRAWPCRHARPGPRPLQAKSVPLVGDYLLSDL